MLPPKNIACKTAARPRRSRFVGTESRPEAKRKVGNLRLRGRFIGTVDNSGRVSTGLPDRGGNTRLSGPGRTRLPAQRKVPAGRKATLGARNGGRGKNLLASSAYRRSFPNFLSFSNPRLAVRSHPRQGKPVPRRGRQRR